MFACIHAAEEPGKPEVYPTLLECAEAFATQIERTAAGTVVLDAGGLDRLLGLPQEIAAAIARRARELGLRATIALAANPDAAVHAARGFSGIHVVPQGDEAKYLAPLPLELLEPSAETAETLARWGLRTFRDLAALPEIGVVERLGTEGLRLHRLARGQGSRELVPIQPPLQFIEELELEYAIDLLEPLSFLLAGMLKSLVDRLAARALATNELRLDLQLENGGAHARVLRFPVPMRDPRAFLKLLQLDLSAHPPQAPIVRVRLEVQPVKPRLTQNGLFLPAAPEPEKLEITLARLAVLAGENNVGSPELLDTHRPGAFRMRKFQPSEAAPQVAGPSEPHLAFRAFRPPRPARVELAESCPVRVLAEGIQGQVVAWAGPWRSSGDWWKRDAWDRQEWDMALSDGALYRLYRQREGWFVEGCYD